MEKKEKKDTLAGEEGLPEIDAFAAKDGGPVKLDFSLPQFIKEKFAGGGMVGIRRPSALPPTGGPMSQGLPSLYNNVRKR